MNPRLAAGVGVVAAVLFFGGPAAAPTPADPGDSRGGSDRGSSQSRDNGNGRGGSRGGNNDRSDYRGPGNAGQRGNNSTGGPPVRVGSGRGETRGLTPRDRTPSGESPARNGPIPVPGPSTSHDTASTPPADLEPPPPPAASLVDRLSLPPIVPRHVVVATAAELSGPLWGIAGLLLIPAAGAVIGYRQARGAQAAQRLSRP